MLRCALTSAVLLTVIWSAATNVVQAQVVGETVFARGAATVQLGSDLRLMGNGTPIHKGEVLTTGKGSFAIIKFNDGTRTTLRPNTVFKIEEFEEEEGEENALFKLFKGGLRTVTGLISKKNPDAFKLNTPLATIGIRGTDFSARLCEEDCVAEAQDSEQAKVREKLGTIARVAFVNGTLVGTSIAGEPRQMALGASIYVGDLLDTGENSFAIIAFKDESRITLQANSRFMIERLDYDPEIPEESSAIMRLFSGGLRVVSGLIAKSKPLAYRIVTPVASIMTRGTGYDVICQKGCGITGQAQLEGSRFQRLAAAAIDHVFPAAHAATPDAAGLFVSSGGTESVLVIEYGDSVVEIPPNSIVFFSSDLSSPQFGVDLPKVIADSLRAETEPEKAVVPEDWFKYSPPPEDPDGGLVVAVYDEGHATVEIDGKVQHLGKNEAIHTDGEVALNIEGGIVNVSWVNNDPYNISPVEFNPLRNKDPEGGGVFICTVGGE